MKKVFECTDQSRGALGKVACAEQPALAAVLLDWYTANPRIRRACAYEAGDRVAGQASEVHVLVDVEPVLDSDEVLPVWLAHFAGWRRELQARIPGTVHLGLLSSGTALPSSRPDWSARRFGGVCVDEDE